MAPVRWGIMGSAAIARQAVIPAIQGSRNGRVAAIASRTDQRARDVAAEFGITTAHGSYDALIADAGIDAIYIPLPNSLHVPWSIRAADAGKHVLCEKPISVTAADMPGLIAARERNRVLIAEAFMVRHHPQWWRARELIRAGAIGRLRAVHGVFCEINADPANIVNRPELGGGALRDLGCYPLMFARYLFGREPQRISGRTERDPRTKLDTSATAILDFGDGEAFIHCSTRTTLVQRVQALGERGRIELPAPIIVPADRAAEIAIDDGTTRIERFVPCDHYRLQVEAFADAIRGEGAWEFPLDDALANMRAIDALFRSADSGRWETVA